jgi:Glycosyl hydrolase family 65, C-terminal domain
VPSPPSTRFAGHGADLDGSLCQSLRPIEKRQGERRPMDPDAIDCVVQKFAAGLGLDRGYSAHSMRATVITTALAHGAQLKDVKKAAGHRGPGTTKLYDDPQLPASWRSLGFRLQSRTSLLKIRIEQAKQSLEVTLEAGAPMTLFVSGERHELHDDRTLHLWNTSSCISSSSVD